MSGLSGPGVLDKEVCIALARPWHEPRRTAALFLFRLTYVTV